MGLLDAGVPAGWTWESVEARFRITKKPRTLNYSNAASIPFVPMDGVPAGGAERLTVIPKVPSEITSGTYFEKGDILLSKITPSFENGKQGLAIDLDAPFGVASTEIIPLQAISAEADHRYLFYYFLHPEVRSLLASKMEGSTGRQRVPDEAVRQLLVPFPSKAEQQQIATVLQLVCNAIDAESSILASSHALKRSAMEQMLTRGLNGCALVSTEIGLLPESWAVAAFSAVREFLQYGTSTKCTYDVRGNPVLRIPNILNGRVDSSDLKWCELDANSVADWKLEAGDILFVRTNGVRDRVGSCAVYYGEPDQSLFASYLIRARLNTAVLIPAFFQYFSATDVGRSMLSGRASPAADGKFNINTKALDSVLVPIPSLHEQRDIVEILSTIDRKIDVHKRKRATLQDLFNTLLHELMTGRIRVADLDIDALAGAGPQVVEAS